MISERNYREKLTEEQALKEIRKGSGSLYDPGVVAALEAILKPGNCRDAEKSCLPGAI